MINWEWVQNKAIPVLWLWTAAVIIGACIGVWLR